MEHTMASKHTKKVAVVARKGFDLASRYATDSVVVSIMDPAELVEDVDTGIRVEIGSLYSKEATDAIRSGRAQLALVNGETTAAEGVVSTFLDQTIAVTKRWWIEGETTDTILIDGEYVAATPETVRAVYTAPRTAWLQKQVENKYLDLRAFFGAPKTA
jgi:hypothetical protein